MQKGRNARYWNEFKVGEVIETVGRTVESGDVSLFAGLSGDFNPVHLNEVHAKKSQFGFYYGGMYAQRNAFNDVTAPPGAVVSCFPGAPAVNRPCIGFGGTNSSPTANRAIQEATFDWTQTFWRNPQYGAVFLVTQTSYLTRSPWFVPAGAPKNAHLVQSFVSLRYALP